MSDKPLKAFDYINDINFGKKNLMVDDDAEKVYVSFLTNRGLSYFQDTVLLANEMNVNHHIDSKLQYDFLRNIVRPRKRFSKWAKAETLDKVDVIAEYYDYSRAKAASVADLIDDDTLDSMKKYLSKGGKR